MATGGLRRFLGEPAQELEPVHLGHVHVRDDEHERIAVSTHERESAGAVLRFEHVAMPSLQHACQHAALKAVVVDDENVAVW